jgi:hypothetical protein
MIISVINQSTVKTDDEVQQAIRAVNRQIAEDVAPYWGVSATLRLDATKRGGTIRELRGDALIRIRDDVQAGHIVGTLGVPEGVVFTELPALSTDVHPWLIWTASLSHEAIELLLDPQLNTLHAGPHPNAKRQVFYYREVCDPVQGQIYTVDGIAVSNFVLPAYYTPGLHRSSTTNFLGTPLRAFGWIGDGSVAFWDPRLGRRGQYVLWPPWDRKDIRRRIAKFKKQLNAARLLRYAKPVRDGRPR